MNYQKVAHKKYLTANVVYLGRRDERHNGLKSFLDKYSCFHYLVVKKYFWPFGRFRIEGQKQQNSDFQSNFSMSKNDRNLLNFFIIEGYKKRESNFCYCHFLITLIFNVVVEGPIFNLQF